MEDALTCICCRQTFETPNGQRDHYRSDYHRFNLKRKVLNLPSVSNELFQQKVQELKEKQTTKEIFSGYCTFCKKKFSNAKTYSAHVGSKKHLEREKLAKKAASAEVEVKGPTSTITKKPIEPIVPAIPVTEEPLKTEQEYIDEKIANAHKFEVNECLVCMAHSDTIEGNMEHMAKIHGLYIPDLEYVTDLGGLVSYLGEKVGTGNACLYCNKIFRDTEAVGNHMRMSNHAKLKYEGEDLEEFQDFYDFSKTWNEVEGESEFNEEEDITPEQEQQLILKTKKGIVEVGDGGFYLTLANGKQIGHRELMVYYKQYYRRSNIPAEGVLNRYRTLGWKTSLTKKERTDQRKQARTFYKQQMQVSVKSNKLQKFFREQVLY